jgi:ABC-type glycerol-3-phosphate transport system substrate-binding protein
MRTPWTFRRLAALGASLAVVLAACGGTASTVSDGTSIDETSWA